jgi:hypothetical protein
LNKEKDRLQAMMLHLHLKQQAAAAAAAAVTNGNNGVNIKQEDGSGHHNRQVCFTLFYLFISEKKMMENSCP